MNLPAIKELSELEALRGSRVVVYCSGDRTGSIKSIEDKDVTVLYECLCRLGSIERLDLVLHTFGGCVNATRKILLILRSFASQVNILVPYKARSAGTLLCLGANQIVMGSLAELSPIDPQIGAVGKAPAGTPSIISSEDIRAFLQMSKAWFGLQSEEHRMQVFRLLSERIFPTSLGSFFRADQHTRQIANELLQYQIPDVDPGTRERIVEHLISGYHTHEYCITQAEAEKLGLRVRSSSTPEEALIWDIWKHICHYLDTHTRALEQPGKGGTVNGVIASTNFTAKHVIRWSGHLYTNEPKDSIEPCRWRMEDNMNDWEIL